MLALFLGLRLVATRTIAGHDYHRDLVLVGIIVLSAVSSIAVLVVLRRKSPGQHRAVATASILIDATMVAMGLWGLALWPPAEYAGMLQSPSSGFILLAISCAALRFSVPLVTVALVLNGATLLSLFAFEQMVQHRPMELEAALTLLTLYATFATLAYSIVIRGRQLMIDGSMSVLDTARVARHLGAFVSEEVAERALSGQEFALGGQRRPVVCLFSDLRGFTQYSERIEPEQLVAELNDYLEAMGTAIESEGGLIDKFIGDSIMVVFGMTDTSPDDAAHAVRTARAMQRALASHNSRRSGQGLPPIAQGIGIHMGAAIVGNIGTASRMQQTVVGSVVNIASRLESATKELHVAVVMSEAVAQAAQAHSKDLPTLRALPPVRLRGLAEPLPICTFAGDGIQPSVADVAS
ncbi:MAG: adenylate/guanylate cyclase domain-containing protein [Polyangia bacterium]